MRRSLRALARRCGVAALLIAGLTTTAQPAPAASTTIEARAQRVVDGDSLWIEPAGGGVPIELRLLGIDAPEICQPWGPEAKQALAELVAGRELRVDLGAVDVHGRRLGTVYVDSRNVNRTLVQEGHAWSARYKWDRGPYVADERMARALGRGLNREPGAQMPRDFRREHGPCEGRAAVAQTSDPKPVAATAPPAARAAAAWRCDGRTRCSQMTSCAEATWFLKHCPGVQMDGDGDGVPCETQWCRR